MVLKGLSVALVTLLLLVIRNGHLRGKFYVFITIHFWRVWMHIYSSLLFLFPGPVSVSRLLGSTLVWFVLDCERSLSMWMDISVSIKISSLRSWEENFSTVYKLFSTSKDSKVCVSESHMLKILSLSVAFLIWKFFLCKKFPWAQDNFTANPQSSWTRS